MTKSSPGPSPDGSSPATSATTKRAKQASLDFNGKQRKKSLTLPASGPLLPGMPFSYDSLAPKLELGYTGSVAASAILLEQEAKDGGATDSLDGMGDTVPAHSLAVRRQYYISILATLPSRKLSQTIFDTWVQPKESANVRSMVKVQSLFHDTFWATFADDLQTPRKAENLARLAELLCQNTVKPQGIPETTSAWFDSINGVKSRWEMVGLLFIRYAIFAKTANHPEAVSNELVPSNTDQRKVATTMFLCAEACLNIAENLDAHTNMLVVFLRERCFTIQSVLEGDTSFALWRQAGALVNAATALGLHRDIETKSPVSLLYLENRKQIFWQLWGTQQNVAHFAGRPNALSWRYITLSKPLDVREESLIHDDWTEVASSLNEFGWNSSGQMSENTIRRVYAFCNLIRDELIELSLGVPQEDFAQRIAAIRRKIDDIFAGMSRRVQQVSESVSDSFSDPANHYAYYSAQTKLRRCQLLFMVERIAHPHNLTGEHLAPAIEILSIITKMWLERDPLIESNSRDTLHWIIASFGIPAASAISMDLYKQTRAMQGVMFSSSQRPEIVQQLSVFIAALAWIRSEDGNYELCRRARVFIKGVLDCSLDTSKADHAFMKEHMPTNNLGDEYLPTMPAFDAEFETWLQSTDSLDIPFVNEDDASGLQQGDLHNGYGSSYPDLQTTVNT
ncbi:MAG: hypothetical protein M1828_003732 [Chrysothrix sp. TS-e1954]|nr:MAG: hypothetical protein M1828_003732 [Chrysothrix sp. TS-e1954]